MNELPAGSVTFLFTDIEGSTRLWEQHPTAMRPALGRHDAIIRAAVAQHEGYVFNTAGDAFCVAFTRASDALAAALDIQRNLRDEEWGEVGAIKVRIALHTGQAEPRGGDYVGLPLSQVARLLYAAHGGQTLLSAATRELVADALPPQVSLRDMGERRLRDLSNIEHIYQLVAPDLPADFPPLRTLDPRRHNLPAQVTSFVGRERELGEVVKLLRRPEVRLLTLTGPGGTGKTRLSLQVAATLADDFEQIWFVPLAAISEPQLVISSIAQTLGVKETAGQTLLAALQQYLRDQPMLLVLDNFEQVVAAAPLLEQLLTAAPGLKALVSSREVLHLYGEHEYSVPPLALPNLKHPLPLAQLEQYAAIALFVARARAAQLDFTLNEENAEVVAKICARLDGLPLAIELAAARSKLFSPRQILTGLSNRLALLTGGFRDLPARQRSLRGAIDWSYDLLPRAEQQLFARIAIFVGGFTTEAVEQVCADPNTMQDGAVLDLLASLVDKSLLRQEPSKDDEPRFLMLDTVREYALERLAQPEAGRYAVQKTIREYAAARLAESGEETTLHQRHAEYYIDLAERADPELRGSAQAVWLNRLEAEHDNIRDALNWLLNTDQVEQSLRLSGAMGRFWYARNYITEGRGWLDTVLSKANNADRRARAKALAAAARLVWIQGDYLAAHQLVQQSLTLRQEIGDQRGMSESYTILGGLAWQQGDYTEARNGYEAALAIQRLVGDEWGIAASLNNLGLLALVEGKLDEAHTMYEASLVAFRKLRDQRSIANVLTSLGMIADRTNLYEDAIKLHEQARIIFEQLGERRGIAATLTNLADAYIHLQQYEQATNLCREGLRLYADIGEKSGVADTMSRLSRCMENSGRPYQAAIIQAAVESLRQSLALPVTESGESEYQTLLLRTGAEPEQFAASWAQGQAMTLDEAITYGLAAATGTEVAKLAPNRYNYATAAHYRAATLCHPLF